MVSSPFNSKSTSESTQSGEEKQLKQFISRDPRSQYTFDSERDAPQSEICRGKPGESGRECVILQMNSKRMFQSMQSLGFYCALPIEPGKTYMECNPLPK